MYWQIASIVGYPQFQGKLNASYGKWIPSVHVQAGFSDDVIQAFAGRGVSRQLGFAVFDENFYG
jgi:hypothetical protein